MAMVVQLFGLRLEAKLKVKISVARKKRKRH